VYLYLIFHYSNHTLKQFFL